MPRRGDAEEDEDGAPAGADCPARVKNCEGGGLVTPGAKLCKLCAQSFLAASGKASRIKSMAEDMLTAAGDDCKFIVLNTNGEPVSDWTIVRSEAKYDMGLEVAARFMPKETTCSDLQRSEKYPSKGRDGTRTFANALHVHVYAAHVAFVLKESRKPKGEEIHKFMHAAWAMYLEASEQAADVEEEDEHLEVGAVYALEFGDTVTYETTNTYPLDGFKNATNHGRLVAEVTKARKELAKGDEEAQLRLKWGLVSKRSVDVGNAQIPDDVDLIDFRIVKLGKKDCVVWSSKTYPHLEAARGGARGRGARGRGGRAGPPRSVNKAIALKVTREDWVAMIARYDTVHTTTRNPPELVDEDEEDFNAEVEGETAASKRKKEGSDHWAKVMIALNDVEMHKLMCVGQGRTNSTDPHASLHAKKEEIKKSKERKAEMVAEEQAKKQKKKEETEQRARDMQDKASDAWKQRAVTSHAILENDDMKTYHVQKAQQSIKKLGKLIEGNRISVHTPVRPLGEFLESYGLSELQEHLERETWDLRTMLNSADKPTFESDFSALPAPKRRKLQASLNEEAASMGPPDTPSPVKPLPREKPTFSPGSAPYGGRGPRSGSARSSDTASSHRGGGRAASASARSDGTAMNDQGDEEEEEEAGGEEEGGADDD